MKKSILARGFIGSVASLLGVVAVGCSAEPLSPEEAAEIGVTSEALSRAALTAIPTGTGGNPDARTRAASACTLKSGSDLYHVLAGGIANAGGLTDKIWVAKNNGTMIEQTAVLSAARARAKVVQIDATHCALIGGSSTATLGGTPSAKVDILNFNSSTPGATMVTQSAASDLSTATEGFVLSTCRDTSGTPKTRLVLIGGNNGRNVIVGPEATVAALQAATPWTTSANILTENREDFDADKTDDNEYLVAGGETAGSLGLPTNTVEMFTMTTACVPNAATSTSTTLGAVTKGNVVMYDGPGANPDEHKFVIVKGITLQTGNEVLWNNGEQVTATFSPTFDIARSALGANVVTPAYQPEKVRVSLAGTSRVVMVGGANANLSAAVSAIDEYKGGTTFAADNLASANYQGAVAPFFDSKIDYLAGDSSPGTFGTLAEVITPTP